MAFPLNTVRIYPPIGIARVGNSKDDWFYGPEVPGHFEEPDGGFKDAHGNVKRQVKHSILSVMLRTDSFFLGRPIQSLCLWR